MKNRAVDCCVCNLPIEGAVHTLGGRSYCASHYTRILHDNKAGASPILFMVGAVVVFTVLVYAISAALSVQMSGAVLLVTGIVLAVVPAVLWLIAFYRQDRLEPEPKHYVFGVFLLGALLALSIGQPVIRDLFRVQEWLGNGVAIGILGSILVIGFVQEFLKYTAVRYTVFNSAEFDARVDGIIYGAAAGLGYATALNVQYVVSNGGVDIGAGVVRIAITALVHGSFGGVLGYFLGRAKFEAKGPLWLPTGLSLAAVLNGVVTYVLGEVRTLGGLEFNPWYGMIVAVLVGGGTFLILFRVIRRLNTSELAGSIS